MTDVSSNSTSIVPCRVQSCLLDGIIDGKNFKVLCVISPFDVPREEHHHRKHSADHFEHWISHRVEFRVEIQWCTEQEQEYDSPQKNVACQDEIQFSPDAEACARLQDDVDGIFDRSFAKTI